jgi:hypothetical protein
LKCRTSIGNVCGVSHLLQDPKRSRADEKKCLSFMAAVDLEKGYPDVGIRSAELLLAKVSKVPVLNGFRANSALPVGVSRRVVGSGP